MPMPWLFMFFLIFVCFYTIFLFFNSFYCSYPKPFKKVKYPKTKLVW